MFVSVFKLMCSVCHVLSYKTFLYNIFSNFYKHLTNKCCYGLFMEKSVCCNNGYQKYSKLVILASFTQID